VFHEGKAKRGVEQYCSRKEKDKREAGVGRIKSYLRHTLRQSTENQDAGLVDHSKKHPKQREEGKREERG